MKLIHHWRRFRGYSRFGANTALTAVTNLTLALLGLTSGVLVARLLGPHGRGELAAIQTWPTLIGYFVMLGTDAAVVYFSAGQPECTGRYAGSAAMVGLVASLPLVMVAYLAMPFLLSSQAAAIVTEARFYLFVIPVVALHALCAYVLRARRDFTAWNALRLTPTLAWLIVVAFAWTQSWAGVRFLATAYCAALALLLAPVGLVVRRRVGGSFLPDRGLLKPMLMYGVPCLMTNIPMILNLRMDQMVMAGLLGPEKLGLYVAAVAWAGTINPLLNAVAYVAFPEVAAKNGGAERIIFFARSTRLAALIAGLSAIVLMLLTPLGIVTFFGMKFRGAIPAGVVLVPAGAIAGMNVVIEQGLLGLGEPALVMRSEFTGLAVTAVSLALLLRPFGIMGAAIASMLSYATVAACLLLQSYRVTGNSAIDMLIPRIDEIRRYVERARLLLAPVRDGI